MAFTRRHRAALTASFALFLQAASSPPAARAAEYRSLPEPLAGVFTAPAFPKAFVSPSRDLVLLATPLRFPPVAELARPAIGAGGIEIDPLTNGPRQAPAFVGFELVRISDGTQIAVDVPAGARASAPVWSPDGSRFAFANATERGTELWIGSAATGALHRYGAVRLNPLFGDPIAWLPKGDALLLHVLDADRPPAPPAPPAGPLVREARGNREVEGGDSSATPAAAQFAYYARGTYAILDPQTEALAPLVAAGVYAGATLSPDGRFVAFARYTGGFSTSSAWQSAAHRTVVVDRSGTTVAQLDDIAQGEANSNATPAGPRDVAWQPNRDATLVWIEARKNGGEYVHTLDIGGESRSVLGTPDRLQSIAFLDGTSLALVRDYDGRTKLSRTFEFDVDAPRRGAPVLVGSLKDGDAFEDPGRPLERAGSNGEAVVDSDGTAIFLAGDGYSTSGLRPFVDRLDLKTHLKRRLFQSSLAPLETVLAKLDAHGDAFLVERQSPTEPPDFFVRRMGTHELRRLTHHTDPAPILRTLRPRVVSYKRADGVGCSFVLYLPPGTRPGTPLPTLLWAYPFEFDDRAAASQNANFVQQFDEPRGAVARLAALAGYAVLDDVAMPILGSAGGASETLVAQLEMDARAAIDKAVQIGATDRSRVAVGGHSYGAFMTATLLAHTSLFRAGIARSGAYNRTLTPFGFQNEPRSFWQASELYVRLSPFAYADKIASPLLLIHGALDENPATPPLQSERMYEAIRGNGGTARLVIFPNESHTYASLEAVEATEAETLDWLDRYVKATH
jgi:dipeptidyl aminopeptidase/acylaminoacyl peptidase